MMTMSQVSGKEVPASELPKGVTPPKARVADECESEMRRKKAG